MKNARWMGFALAGLLLFTCACAGCGAGTDAAKRELVVAAGGDEIFVLDTVKGVIHELKHMWGVKGAYRTLPYKPDEGTTFFPIGQVDAEAAVKFYGADNDGPFELAVLKGEDGYSWKKTRIDFDSESATIATVDENVFILITEDGTSIVNGDGISTINRPDGNFASPVVAKHPDGDWFIIWPEKTGTPERKGGVLDFTMAGYGKPGRFTIQVIAADGAVSEYTLHNDAFVECRAQSLVGAVIDDKGQLILLDDKGYLSTYSGTEMLANVFGQIAPSRYAMNTMALGPDDTVLVTDAVGNMVSMIDPINGKVICSWRLPQVKTKFPGLGLGIMDILIDLVLILVVIVLVTRIRTRMRRYRRYREEGEK